MKQPMQAADLWIPKQHKAQSWKAPDISVIIKLP